MGMSPESPAAADPFDELAAAVHGNDAAAAAGLLLRHPELGARLDQALPGGHFGATALGRAVQHRNRELIDALLRAGADINGRSHWWAGGFGVLDADHDLVEFLVERGAVIDAYAAARHGMMERLEELVSRDPRVVHMRGGDGQTPLHVAKTVEVARFLLDHGAEIDALDVDHESTPAQYLVSDRPEVARFLVARGCRTDIVMAAVLGDRGLVERLLAADPTSIHATVSERTFPKRNPHAGGTIYIYTLGANKTTHALAHERGHEDVFRLLMERSPVELRLAVACELGDEAMYRDLLMRDPDAARHLPEAAKARLPGAAQDNNTTAVGMMLAAGWPVDAVGQHGATALHWAAFHGNAAMVREILKYRPPLEAKDAQYGLPALGWATYGSIHGWHREAGDYAKAVEVLLQAGAEAPAKPDASEAVQAVLRRFEAPA